MEKAKRAGDGPVPVELESGKTYAWCACGHSKKQPFCDGSHVTTDFKPFVFKADETGTKYMCMCKESKNHPYCDGSHKN